MQPMAGWHEPVAAAAGGTARSLHRQDPDHAALLWLAAEQVLPLWAIWLLLARELLITGWRSGLSSGGPASTSAKAKTVLQFAALVLMLWPAAWPWLRGCKAWVGGCSGPRWSSRCGRRLATRQA